MLRFTRHSAGRIVASLLVATLSASVLADTASAAAPSPSTAASPASPGTYTVRSGDSISLIAMRMKVKMKALMSANGLTINSIIHPGDVLVVPQGGVVPEGGTPAAAPATYTVVRGDSLIRISATLKVTLKDLLKANKLTVDSLIVPGMVLKVPASAATPAPSGAGETAASEPPTPTAAPLVYVVVSGDYLGKIASRTKVSLKALLKANKLSMTSVIFPGDRLVIPEGGVVPGAPTATETPAAERSSVQQVIDFALAQKGKPYKFNTAGPDAFDCSGLTMAAFAVVGISLPHYSGAQVGFGDAVEWTTDPIKPGDLIFLETFAGSGVIGHVGIAISATEWVQAPRSGDVVRTSTIPVHRIVAVRRLLED
ncbi:MAG: LysM peptidoglycan-binding domain-containing protein [Ilumatobacteraceae bacterium]